MAYDCTWGLERKGCVLSLWRWMRPQLMELPTNFTSELSRDVKAVVQWMLACVMRTAKKLRSRPDRE